MQPSLEAALSHRPSVRPSLRFSVRPSCSSDILEIKKPLKTSNLVEKSIYGNQFEI